MVRGLDKFRDHFAAYADRYVLIGGSAATLAMDEAGLKFRATKDLDIVLIVEALDADFGQRMWQFVEAGGYEIRQGSHGRPRLYRFTKPADPSYPFMIELFSRRPDDLALGEDARLTPLPIDEAISSLSAILLDDAYYEFVIQGRRQGDNLAWVGADRLIPLKASAWLDLRAREVAGDHVDSHDIRKHLNDVFRLSQLLPGDLQIALPGKLAMALSEFLNLAGQEKVDLKSLEIIGPSQAEILIRLRAIYGLTEQ